MLTRRQPLNTTMLGDADSLGHLKRIAWICVVLQYWAAVVYLFCSLMVPESNDAAVGCGILAILLAITPAFYAFFYKRFMLLFSCVSVFNIAPIWFLYLEAILPGYDAYVYILPAVRMESFFWVAAFLIMVNTVYIIFWRSVSCFSIRTFIMVNVIKLKPVFYQSATIVCFTFPLIAFCFIYPSLDSAWLSLTAGRSEEGKLIQESLGIRAGLMLPINSVWQLTPLLSAITFVSSTKKLQCSAFLCLGLGLTVCFFYFLSGSRGTMMLVGAPLLFFLFYYNWDRGLKFWIVITAILFMLIGVMELQVRFRENLLDVIADPARAAQERGMASATTFNPTESHRDNNMYLLCLMIQGYPNKYPFKGFGDFFTILVNPIPRAIWPDKPIWYGTKDLSQQAAFILDGPLFMGTTSLSFSVVGDSYLAGGTMGLLVYALVYGFLLLFFDGVVYYAHRDRPISVGILGLSLFLAFWGFRAFFALVTFSYPIIIFILFLKVVQIVKTNANHVYSA